MTPVDSVVLQQHHQYPCLLFDPVLTYDMLQNAIGGKEGVLTYLLEGVCVLCILLCIVFAILNRIVK